MRGIAVHFSDRGQFSDFTRKSRTISSVKNLVKFVAYGYIG